MAEEKKEYENLDRIILLVEDDPEQRSNLEKTALRYLGDEPGSGMCVAKNTTEVVEELSIYKEKSPKATISAVMDYNMGLSDPGHKRPTEALFYDETFMYFLENGGIVIIYSGYPEQVWQSPEIISAPKKYPNLALLVAEKSTVQMEDVFRIVKGATPAKIASIKAAAEKYQLDLGKIIAAHRRARR